jgi:hypothetical protein
MTLGYYGYSVGYMRPEQSNKLHEHQCPFNWPEPKVSYVIPSDTMLARYTTKHYTHCYATPRQVSSIVQWYSNTF